MRGRKNATGRAREAKMGWLASVMGVLGRRLCLWVSPGRVWGEEWSAGGAWSVSCVLWRKPSRLGRGGTGHPSGSQRFCHRPPGQRAEQHLRLEPPAGQSASLAMRPQDQFWGGGKLKGTQDAPGPGGTGGLVLSSRLVPLVMFLKLKERMSPFNCLGSLLFKTFLIAALEGIPRRPPPKPVSWLGALQLPSAAPRWCALRVWQPRCTSITPGLRRHQGRTSCSGTAGFGRWRSGLCYLLNFHLPSCPFSELDSVRVATIYG